MKNFLKILALSFVLIMPAVSLTACGNDDSGESDKPEIFDQLEYLLPELESALVSKSRDQFVSKLNEFKGRREFEVACKDYNESVGKAKKPAILAMDYQNSGYYKAMYILLYNVSREADKISAFDALEAFFKGYPGCEDILNHARECGKD